VLEPVANPNNVVVANLITTSSNDDPDNNTATVRIDIRLSSPGMSPVPAPGEAPEGEILVVEGTEGVVANMALNSQPSADVTIEFITDAQLNPIPPLTFTPSNWNDIQQFVISAQEDFTAEGRHTGTISFTISSADPAYNALQLPSLTVFIDDNDQPGIIITL
jgi:hypothetical protein